MQTWLYTVVFMVITEQNKCDLARLCQTLWADCNCITMKEWRVPSWTFMNLAAELLLKVESDVQYAKNIRKGSAYLLNILPHV